MPSPSVNASSGAPTLGLSRVDLRADDRRAALVGDLADDERARRQHDVDAGDDLAALDRDLARARLGEARRRRASTESLPFAQAADAVAAVGAGRPDRGARRDRRRAAADRRRAPAPASRIDDRGGPRGDRARRRDRRNRAEQHAELAARDELRIARERARRSARGAAVRPAEPAQLILLDERRDLGRVRAAPSARARSRPRRAGRRRRARGPRSSPPRASASSGTPLPGLELDAAGRQIAGRERVGDPAAVRHALDAERAVVAAARVARRLIVADRPQLDRGDEPGAFVAIDHATDDDRAASSRSSTGANGPAPSRFDAHGARRERALLRVDLVATLRQVRRRRTRPCASVLRSSVPPIASPRMPTVAFGDGLAAVGDRARDRDLPRDDDARVVGRHRHIPHLGGEQARAGDAQRDSGPASRPSIDEAAVRAGRRCATAMPASATPASARPTPASPASAQAGERVIGAPCSGSAVTSAPATGMPAPSTTTPVSCTPRGRAAADAFGARTRGTAIAARRATPCATAVAARRRDRDDRESRRRARRATRRPRTTSRGAPGSRGIRPRSSRTSNVSLGSFGWRRPCLPISARRTCRRRSRSIEEVLGELGHDPPASRIDDRRTHAWRISKGSAVTRVTLVNRTEFTHLRVCAVVMTLDDKVDRAGAVRAPARAQRDAVRRRVRDRRRSGAARQRALDARPRSQRGPRADPARHDVRRRPRRRARRAVRRHARRSVALTT